MIRRKYILLSAVIEISIIYLTGCTNNPESNTIEANTVMVSEERQSEIKEEPEQKESENETGDTSEEIPQLPGTGRQLEDFVPKGWELLDNVELDFNEDGITDYVGVLQVSAIDMGEYVMCPDYPRILFAIASDGPDEYRLDFQDINLIRKMYDEGSNWPLTAEGTSFTTHASGGKAWRWSENYTYTYREGIWWLTSSEEASEYDDYITDYSKDDWESGVGIRKKRSSEFDDMEENWESEEYDVVYELTLDEPLTLEQAGKRCHRAPVRVTDWTVEAITFAADIELTEDMVKLPDGSWVDYNDENCALYAFNPDPLTGNSFYYLAMYCWQDKGLHVLIKEEAGINNPTLYKGKIYYSTEIVENVTYKTMQDGQELITDEKDIVGIRLNRIDLDGTGKETVFEYRYQETEEEIRESRIPSLRLSYEISGDEIIAEVHIGGEPHPFYRMKTDGSERKRIGQMPEE